MTINFPVEITREIIDKAVLAIMNELVSLNDITEELILESILSEAFGFEEWDNAQKMVAMIPSELRHHLVESFFSACAYRVETV